jgi:hypothetical protein
MTPLIQADERRSDRQGSASPGWRGGVARQHCQHDVPLSGTTETRGPTAARLQGSSSWATRVTGRVGSQRRYRAQGVHAVRNWLGPALALGLEAWAGAQFLERLALELADAFMGHPQLPRDLRAATGWAC